MSGTKTVDELSALWNNQAENINKWDELGLDEIVHFAQQELQAEIDYLRQVLAALVERYDLDGVPNDSRGLVEIARAAAKGETT